MNITANNVIVDDDYDELTEMEMENMGAKPTKSKPRPKSSSELVKLNASSKKGFVKNVQQNSNKNLLKVLGFGVMGAVMYPLVPTLVQAVSDRDMSGWPGMLLGVGSASLLGLGIGKPEMAVGAISAMGTHLLYAKGTRVIEEVTNTPIYRMNPLVVSHYVEEENQIENENQLVNN